MTIPYRPVPISGKWLSLVRPKTDMDEAPYPAIRGQEKLSSDDYTSLYELDTDLYNLIHKMAKNTAENREQAFWHEVLAPSACEIISASIFGDGPRFRCKTERAREVIEGWNRKINVQRQSIADFHQHSYFDGVVHGTPYWRVMLNDELKYKIDVARIDPKTITPYTHPETGWSMLIQDTYKSKEATNTRTERNFYNLFPVEYDPTSKHQYASEPSRVFIPDREEFILKVPLFVQPPMSYAITPCIYKMWILWFIRKIAEKYYAPFLKAKVGDMDHMPDTEEELKSQLTNLNNILKMWRGFGGVALPGNQDIEAVKLDYQPAKDLIGELQYMDEMIVISCGLPKPMVSAEGAQLAASRPVEATFLRGIGMKRYKFAQALIPFYENVLLPANDITDERVEMDYGSLQWSNIIDQVQALNIGRTTGVFKDWEELRRAARGIWSWLEELDKSENIDFSDTVKNPQAAQLPNSAKPNSGTTNTGSPQARATPSKGAQGAKDG